MPFDNTDDATAGIKAIEADYATHSAGALELAKTIFSPQGVLAPLLAKL
jgi:hypothetical protein